ncbi:hypothetical protein B0H13DRAFT_2293373 [Mycena leptocephala]|nr:hypothetical protein B0H13DRAFT_2293373 [Mycena leptocephala]
MLLYGFTRFERIHALQESPVACDTPWVGWILISTQFELEWLFTKGPTEHRKARWHAPYKQLTRFDSGLGHRSRKKQFLLAGSTEKLLSLKYPDRHSTERPGSICLACCRDPVRVGEGSCIVGQLFFLLRSEDKREHEHARRARGLVGGIPRWGLGQSMRSSAYSPRPPSTAARSLRSFDWCCAPESCVFSSPVPLPATSLTSASAANPNPFLRTPASSPDSKAPARSNAKEEIQRPEHHVYQ